MTPRPTGDGDRRTREEAPLVLLVDDFEDAREMYADHLEASGFRTEQAADGHDALAKARALVPDVILMDLSLPGIDGWEVTRRLKRDLRMGEVVILALTAHAFRGEEERALAAGCDGFIPKPCLPQAVVERIRQELAARRGSR